MVSAKEQRDHYKIPGKYKDSQSCAQDIRGQKEGGREFKKSFWEEVKSILEIWRGKGFGQREQCRGKCWKGYWTV